MREGAERVLPQRRSATVTPIRPLPLDTADAGRDRLLRRLAADRLRDLRDDGVTIGYMARMYEVDPALMEEMIGDLALGTR